MDGQSLLTYGADAIGGVAEPDLWYWWKAVDYACSAWVKETRSLRPPPAQLGTVAGQDYLSLPADFIGLWHRSRTTHRFLLKYTDGAGATNWISGVDEGQILALDHTLPALPQAFALQDPVAPGTRITGTATASSTGAAPGEAFLEDAAADFAAVAPRDAVFNTTDGSTGVVLAVESPTRLRLALFNGESNTLTLGDAYLIEPQPRYRIRLDAPALVDGHTLAVPYLARPAPIYSAAGSNQLPTLFTDAVAQLAAWKFKQDFDFDPKQHSHLTQAFVAAVADYRRELARLKLAAGRRSPRRW